MSTFWKIVDEINLKCSIIQINLIDTQCICQVTNSIITNSIMVKSQIGQYLSFRIHIFDTMNHQSHSIRFESIRYVMSTFIPKTVVSYIQSCQRLSQMKVSIVRMLKIYRDQRYLICCQGFGKIFDTFTTTIVIIRAQKRVHLHWLSRQIRYIMNTLW